jgi:glycosyltransferase involved in cell wall biosynthesis
MSSSTPIVSIIIPTYAHERVVEETLRSVAAQTFTDFEIIVINDGSPDNTAALLKPYAEAGHIRYFEQPNAGQSAARNAGLRIARGRYIAFLDDDDLWPPDKLAAQVTALDQTPAAVMVYGYADTFGLGRNYRSPSGEGASGDVLGAFLSGNEILSPGQTLIRAEVLRKLDGFDEAIWGTDDWDLWLRLAAAGPVIYQNKCALQYRLHGNNASRNTKRLFTNGIRVLHKHLGRFPLKHRRDWINCRLFIGRYSSIAELGKAIQCVDQKRRLAAFGHLLAAARYHPPLPLTRRFWSTLFRRRQLERA